jgi:malate dehydrogenase
VGDHGHPLQGGLRHPGRSDVRLSRHLRSGEYKIVEGLPIDAFSQECMNKTLAELQEEQDGVKHLL